MYWWLEGDSAALAVVTDGCCCCPLLFLASGMVAGVGTFYFLNISYHIWIAYNWTDVLFHIRGWQSTYFHWFYDNMLFWHSKYQILLMWSKCKYIYFSLFYLQIIWDFEISVLTAHISACRNGKMWITSHYVVSTLSYILCYTVRFYRMSSPAVCLTHHFLSHCEWCVCGCVCVGGWMSLLFIATLVLKAWLLWLVPRALLKVFLP